MACSRLTMLETLGDDTEGERLDASDSLVSVLTVGHDARQRGHFGQPTAVVFSLDFNRERHSGNVPSGRPSNKAMDLTPCEPLSRPARRRSSPMRWADEPALLIREG
jgi:hypothetical protein